jgi:cytochrome P450
MGYFFQVDKLVARILSHQDSKPCNLFMAFRSATLDIIASYCFAKSFDTLDDPGFEHPLLLAILAGITATAAMQYFPFLHFVNAHAPGWLLVRFAPVSKGYVDLFNQLSVYLDGIITNPRQLEAADHETVYHHLLFPTKSHHEVPSKESLLEESVTLLGAGSETVGNVVTTGVFHVLNNETILQKLIEELEVSWPDSAVPMTYRQLEKLPYLVRLSIFALCKL